MSVVVAYDFDGVLAVKPPRPAKPWGKMNGLERSAYQQQTLKHYMLAEALLVPVEDIFHVITARKATPEVQRVSRHWLETRYGSRVLSVSFLQTARSIENVVKFKAEVLHALQVRRFIEDNLAVLKGLSKNPLCAEVELIYFNPKNELVPLKSLEK